MSAGRRLAYLAAAILIYHQSIAGKGHWYILRWLLFPLLALQLARIAKTWLFPMLHKVLVGNGLSLRSRDASSQKS